MSQPFARVDTLPRIRRRYAPRVSGQLTDPETLKGRPSISYFRWSSAPQGEDGTDSEPRQEATLRFIADHYGLFVDQKLIDRAKSGWKGHNRTRGQLGDLLDSCRAGLIPKGTPLIIESISRLSREGAMKTFGEILRTLVGEGGMIIIDGKLRIWDEGSLNSSENIGLLVDINAAKDFADDLSFYAKSVHESRRIRLEAFRLDPTLPRPLINSPPPAWIVCEPNINSNTGKPDGTAEYPLHPENAAIVKLIFELYVGGYSVWQIAKYLNKHNVPVFDIGKRTAEEWRAPRIGAILRDEAVRGWYQPCERVVIPATDTEPERERREPVGERVRLYTPAIEDGLWFDAKDTREGKFKGLRGKRGESVPNLFVGKLLCKTCDKAMRVVTPGAKKSARRWVCARYYETGMCPDGDRYNVNHWEPRLLHVLCTSFMVQRPRPDDKLAQEIVQLKLRREELDKDIPELRKGVGSSPTRRAEYNKATDEKDALDRKIRKLEDKQAAEAIPEGRRADVMGFIKDLLLPAWQGDLDARQQLRALISKLDFKVYGHRDGLRVIYGDYDLVLPTFGKEDRYLLVHLPRDGGEPVVVLEPSSRPECA